MPLPACNVVGLCWRWYIFRVRRTPSNLSLFSSSCIITSKCLHLCSHHVCPKPDHSAPSTSLSKAIFQDPDFRNPQTLLHGQISAQPSVVQPHPHPHSFPFGVHPGIIAPGSAPTLRTDQHWTHHTPRLRTSDISFSFPWSTTSPATLTASQQIAKAGQFAFVSFIRRLFAHHHFLFLASELISSTTSSVPQLRTTPVRFNDILVHLISSSAGSDFDPGSSSLASLLHCAVLFVET